MRDPVWLVSIHDLMPSRMALVKRLTALLDEHGVGPLTLLVVPGYDWHADDLRWLAGRAERGDQLAGHGWSHLAGPPRSMYDRIHRALFSRGVAEHLALDSRAAVHLMQRCHQWFVDRPLPVPEIYVPPAWAMGAVSRKHLRDTVPFRYFETLAGIYDAQRDRFAAVPLAGFEADDLFRQFVLRLSNSCNRLAARVTGRLRVAIHPGDLQLRLGPDLRRLVREPARCVTYADGIGGLSTKA